MFKLSLHIYSIEMRKLLSYPLEFWFNFIGQILMSFFVSYFLWKDIFSSNGVTEMNGFSFDKLLVFYLISPLTFRTVQGEASGYISQEIYLGSLNKYLIYPISFINYKRMSYYTHASFYFFQLLIMSLIIFFVFPEESASYLNIKNLFFFSLSIFFALNTYFMLSNIIETIAFWADHVWSLTFMVRVSVSILGGALIPLQFFPEAFQTFLSFTPFPYFISFPINTFFGEVPMQDFIKNSLILMFWYIFFHYLLNRVWRKGLHQYAGVGI